jgi:hypothetical protein
MNGQGLLKQQFINSLTGKDEGAKIPLSNANVGALPYQHG